MKKVKAIENPNLFKSFYFFLVSFVIALGLSLLLKVLLS
jgi:hypothetical protein